MSGLTDPLSRAYLHWCEREGVPLTTRRRREATLRSIGIAGTATREQLEAWWHTRSDLAPATRACDLANVRSFYRWALTWEHVAIDPSKRLPRPKVPNGLPHPVSEADLATLLATYRDTRPDIFRAIVLGARLGLRIAEAATLRWANIDQENRTVDVRGKGSKARRIAITRDQLEQLGPPREPDCVVVTGTPDALSAPVLGGRVNRAMRAAGVDATFHKLRHRAGTAAHRATKDIVATRDFLGHSSIATTQVYALATAEAAQHIAEAL